MTEPRYVVRIVRFVVRDESGLDFLDSDEPYWIFTGPGRKRERQHNPIQGVRRRFRSARRFLTDNNRNIVWPKKGDVHGAAAPLALSVQLWESDEGDPDDVAATTQQLFDLASEAPLIGDWIRLVPSIVRDQLSDLIADDLLGSTTLGFSTSRLRRKLPQPGASFEQKIRVGGHSGDIPIPFAGGADYDFFVEVSRVA